MNALFAFVIFAVDYIEPHVVSALISVLVNYFFNQIGKKK